MFWIVFAKLCSFLVACFTGLSDFAIKSSSSEINTCVLPSCFLKGRPRDAGPLPDNTRNEDDLKNKEDLKNEDNLKN